MQALSTATNKTYESWEELVAAESNGWLVIALVSSPTGQTWPWVVGPFTDKADAERARNRKRAQFKREQRDYPDHTYKMFVRPAWKDVR